MSDVTYTRGRPLTGQTPTDAGKPALYGYCPVDGRPLSKVVSAATSELIHILGYMCPDGHVIHPDDVAPRP
jgi:hypothetical protein